MDAQDAPPGAGDSREAANLTTANASPDGLDSEIIPPAYGDAPPDTDDLAEFLRERGAIAEYDGELSRQAAEQQATQDALARWPLVRLGTVPETPTTQEKPSVPPLADAANGADLGESDELPPLSVYADEAADNAEGDAVTAADFWAYLPQHVFIFVPTRETWPAASVNARIPPIDIGAPKPVKPSVWLDQNQAVEQATWCPGMPMVIEDKLVSGDGWIERKGCRTFNLYRPPTPLEQGHRI